MIFNNTTDSMMTSKNINSDEIEKKILSNGQNMSDLQVLEV